MRTAVAVGSWGTSMPNMRGPMMPSGVTPTITATLQATYPPRILITVTNLTPGQTVSVERTAVGDSTRAKVRQADEVTVTDPSLVLLDAEEPLGVALTYHLIINGAEVASVGPITATISKAALSDAISGSAAEIVILAWPDKSRDSSASVFKVGGRNIVVSGSRGQFTSEVTIFTETELARQSLLALLDSATQNILLLRQPGGYYGVDAYLSVLSDTESRFSQDGSDERRTWKLDVAEVGPWAVSLPVQTFTLQDIADTYVGLTLADLANDYATLLEVAIADWT